MHPGYGFLAENAAFARTLEDSGITFIGPPASAIEAMGSKTAARELMKKAGVPIVPGTTEAVRDLKERREDRQGDRLPDRGQSGRRRWRQGLPGRAGGRPTSRTPSRAPRARARSSSPTPPSTSSATCPTRATSRSRCSPTSRATSIHLGERDCSIQRRHQKLIEESPAPLVDDELREKIGKIATDAAKAVGYHSAGTIEGLLDMQDGGSEYFFLEMNTRVQVEHCVTEATTGIDIVREQIRIAAGEELAYTQDDVVLRGHAIECRINAEDAAKNFAPAPGTITHYREPSGPGVRVDSGVTAGSEITPLYDPMVAKLIVWDADRELATRRMLRALEEFEVEGVTTLMPFHKAIMASEQWANAETCRDLIEDKRLAEVARAAKAREARRRRRPSWSRATYTVEVSGKRFDVKVRGEACRSRPPATAPRRPGAQAPKRGERKAAGGGVRRHARVAAAGQHVEGARRAGRHRRGGPAASASSRR